jgi:hypothetical protein
MAKMSTEAASLRMLAFLFVVLGIIDYLLN